LPLFAYNVGPTLVYRSLKQGGSNGGDKRLNLDISESTNRLFSDFYYGYYKRVKKYFAIYNNQIYKDKING
jgi:hypothetical protein